MNREQHGSNRASEDSGWWSSNRPHVFKLSLAGARVCDSQQHDRSTASNCLTASVKIFAAAGRRPALRLHSDFETFNRRFYHA